MKKKCKICNKPIRDKDEKVVLWENTEKGMFFSFCHTKCIPRNAEDITHELHGPTEVFHDEEENDPSQIISDPL